MQTTKILLSGVILATLSACGGGGGDSTPTRNNRQRKISRRLQRKINPLRKRQRNRHHNLPR